MEVRFTRRPDGIIEVVVGPALDLFTRALNDAISTRAPRGAVHQGLSSYWIDRSEVAVRRAAENDDEEPFASGNAWYLRLDGDRVVASFDFDPEEHEAESIGLDQFLGVLAQWRKEVIEAGGVHGADASVGIERPPMPMGPAT